MNIIEIHELSKTYVSGAFRRRKVEALQQLSLDVAAGEIFGLLGPNGAGKTTLVKLLLSIVRPTGGSAYIHNQPITEVRARESCGYLPENHRYPPFLTARDTLRLFGSLASVDPSDLHARTTALLEKVGLTSWMDVKIKRFSKGMLQRLGLAQALVNDPSILFLDEPTDGVDPVGRREIRDLLLDLRRQGKTIFLNSHMLSEVEQVCDRVAILDKGKLLRVGTIQDFTKSGVGYELQLSTELEAHLHHQLSLMTVSLTHNGREISFTLKSTRDLNGILDLLRANQIEITQITPLKNSLEDAFIQLIQTPKD